MTGLRPTSALSGRTLSSAMPIVGLAWGYAGSVYGMTVFSPSLPPPSWRITNTWSLWMSSIVAAKTDCANTGGTTMPTPVAVIPLTMKSRRVIISFASFELKFGTGEQRVPPVGIALTRVEDGGGVQPDDSVELRLHRGNRIRKTAFGGDHGGGKV